MNESALLTSPKAEGKDSRSKILAVALKLFTVKGYEGASIEEIRLGAGFKSKASLYTHFKSKDELAQALISGILGQIEYVIIDSKDIAEPLVRFTVIVRGLVKWASGHPTECIFHMMQQQKKLTGEVEGKELSNTELMLLDIVQQLRAQYPVRPIAADALLSMIFVILAQTILDGAAFEDISFDEKVEQIVSICFGVVFSEAVPVPKI
ncbi:putative TetR family transcriptional regulator [Calothrix sp. NIES-4071]|nr:putative TetR family transcriptional regulator [Calothrix sp. NIES-4071]BAZ55810.1 putative TetR family transcriptional regulator [Calothrix sp. NIES-4105]